MNVMGKWENKAHIMPVRVYYSETDAGGVVYHSHYLDMAEHGRTELLRSLDGRQTDIMKDEGIVFVVKNININYNRPGFLDDLLTVETKIVRSEAFTVQFVQRILRDNECLADLQVKVGSISMTEGRPKPIPGDLKKSLAEVVSKS